jgi:DNA-3-methyladenine glycosylase II
MCASIKAMQPTFSPGNFHSICDHLASVDADLGDVTARYGYPPLWARGNSFETLVHIILEQQVSLASAKAALEKLRLQIGQITPEHVAKLSDEELKACYFSRQKIVYVRGLAEAVTTERLRLSLFPDMTDSEIREELTKLNGVGNWTADIYLIMVLHRPDVFPVSDLAVVNAMKRLKQLQSDIPQDQLSRLATGWRPYRSVAAMILWHYYLSSPKNSRLDQRST